MTKQELKKLMDEFFSDENAYFELLSCTIWVKNEYSPTIIDNINDWRVVIPPKQVELEEGDWIVSAAYGVGEVVGGSKYAEKGILRKTEEQARIAADGMLRRNRLSALVAQNGGETEFVEGKDDYYIIRVDGLYKALRSLIHYEPDKVYMSSSTADKVCKILNDGDFEL